MHRSKSRELFDYLVGAGEQRRRHRDTKRLRSLQIYHQLVLGRRLHRQVGGLLAFEDAIDVADGSDDAALLQYVRLPGLAPNHRALRVRRLPLGTACRRFTRAATSGPTALMRFTMKSRASSQLARRQAFVRRSSRIWGYSNRLGLPKISLVLRPRTQRKP